MRREDMADLTAFVTVAEERNFTRAAAKLGLSQSALSQIVRRLEERLGVRLLARTTRNVSPTAAGEQMVQRLAPMLRDIEESIDTLSEFRDKPAGTVRITAVEHAARHFILPAITPLLRDYPDITVEIVADYALAEIVSDRFDAGVRLGEQVAKDMIAARISPEIEMMIVGAPDYLARHPAPKTAQDSTNHRAINLRLPSSETLNAWRLIESGEEIRVRVEGPLILSGIDLIRGAALQGAGLAYLPADMVSDEIKSGRLKQVLENQTPPLPPYYLYYPSRRHLSPAFRLVIDALRHRG